MKVAGMSRWYGAFNEARFKPVAGGYVFQARSSMLSWLRSPKAYSVSEAQKDEILTRLRTNQFRLLRSFLIYMLTFCFFSLFLGLIVFPALHPQSAMLIVAVMMSLAVVSAAPHLIIEVRERKRFSALLKTLPLAAERITLCEANELHARAASFRWLAVQLALCGALTLFAALSAIELTGSERYFRLVLAVAAAFAFVMQVYIIALKWRQRRVRP